jgi:hypothetical protein
MSIRTGKTGNKNQVDTSPSSGGTEVTSNIEDNRPETNTQRKFKELTKNSPQTGMTQLASLGKPHSAQQGLFVKKNNENQPGLPENLKSGIEMISGYSLDDVKVHYNSQRPAQLQAHAFAQGSEIHLASGQEKHLPHEAWHVVQQKQGRVKPSFQLMEKGISSVSMNEGLIQEKSENLHRENNSFETVQRMVTQILPGPADSNTIGRINIVGRPERLFRNSMGDHTTAFASHVESVKLRMENKSLWDGYNGLWTLIESARKLPGYGMKDNLPLTPSTSVLSLPTQGDRLVKAEQELNKLFSDIPSDQESFSKLDQTALALKLQECVNAYLEFRELIPLSAVNVLAVAPGLAGKGKGESFHAAVLTGNEKRDNFSEEELSVAIIGLMDIDAAAIVVAETDPATLQEIAPGLDPKVEPIDRVNLYVKQHLDSIRMAFPNSLEKARISEEYLKGLIIERAKEEMEKIRLILLKRYKNREEEFIRLDANKKSGERFLKRDRENHEKLSLEVENYKFRIAQIEALLGEKLEIPETLDEVMEATNNYEEQKEAKEREEELVNDELKKSPIATQIKVTEKGSDFLISSLEIAGRPASPIKDSMGAHSSAWILHVERVKKALVQKSLGEAWETIGLELLPEAKKMEKDYQKASPPKEDKQDDLKENALNLIENQVGKSVGDFSSPADLAFQLQQYINDFLTYVNYIPGVTREAVDTTGHGEGTFIKVIREFEKYTSDKEKDRPEESSRGYGRSSLKSKRKGKNKSFGMHPYKSDRDEKREKEREKRKIREVNEAIEGLLDLKGLENEEVYRKVHKDLIGKTFPQTVKFLWRKESW